MAKVLSFSPNTGEDKDGTKFNTKHRKQGQLKMAYVWADTNGAIKLQINEYKAQGNNVFICVACGRDLSGSAKGMYYNDTFHKALENAGFVFDAPKGTYMYHELRDAISEHLGVRAITVNS